MDQENELLELSGTVENIIYKNEENGYTVLRLKNDSGELVAVVGCFGLFFLCALCQEGGQPWQNTTSRSPLPSTMDSLTMPDMRRVMLIPPV